jgi:hypothetical protein
MQIRLESLGKPWKALTDQLGDKYCDRVRAEVHQHARGALCDVELGLQNYVGTTRCREPYPSQEKIVDTQ